MAQSIKLKNNNYLDSTSIVHNKEQLSDLLIIKETKLDLTNGKCTNITANVIRKQLNIVILDFEGYSYFESGYNLIGKIPSEYLPKASGYYTDVLLYFPVVISGMNRVAFGRITNNGEVQIYNDTNSANTQIGYIPQNMHSRIHTSWFV